MHNEFTNAERAEVLVQALPYIKKYSGKVVLIKYGGNAMQTEQLKQQVMEDIALLWLIGVKIVLVHGGGPEISQTMKNSPKEVVTPLGIATVPTYDEKVVVATILRAGLPLHQGILNYFDDAQNAFVAAYRKYDKGEDFHIQIEYASTPDLNGKTLILADTMLATGASLEIAYKRLCEEGTPFHTHLVCPVASAYAVEYLQKHLPEEGVTLWVATIDEELTSHSYIVPGLGDAGDLAYGVKK